MKRLALIMGVMLTVMTAVAKDIKTFKVTPNPKMNCENCENKIKKNLRFEKGVKDISTDLASQTITISYDADKTSESKLTTALSKIGYSVTKAGESGCCGAKAGGCKMSSGTTASCCKQKADGAAKGGCCGASKTAKDSKKGNGKKVAKKAKSKVDGTTGATAVK